MVVRDAASRSLAGRRSRACRISRRNSDFTAAAARPETIGLSQPSRARPTNTTSSAGTTAQTAATVRSSNTPPIARESSRAWAMTSAAVATPITTVASRNGRVAAVRPHNRGSTGPTRARVADDTLTAAPHSAQAGCRRRST